MEGRDLFLSALTLGEIRKGVEQVRPRDPAKAAALGAWLVEVAGAFGRRALGVDAAVAEARGRMADAMLAATAGVHGPVLVTRNAAGAEGLGVRVLYPFAAAPG